MAWKSVPLGEVVSVSIETVEIDPTAAYQMAGVYSFGRGLFRREPLSGVETSYKRFHKLSEGMIVLSQLKAWEGAIALVDKRHADCFLSTQFPTFRCDSVSADSEFIAWFLRLPSVWERLRQGARGMGARRDTVSPTKFLELEIPLPSLDEQHAIAQRLNYVEAHLQERATVLQALERETRAMLQNAFNKIVEGADYRPLGEVAPLVRRPVEVELDGEYPELGVRSFGKGTFHKPVLTGADVGNKRLFEIHDGDLLFNIVFAWEGAIAVPGEKDHQRVGSHRFLTCVPEPELATATFLRYYLLSPEGLHKIGTASPGGAGRNRTLGIKKAEQITVPVPSLEAQLGFDKLCALADEIQTIRAETAKEADALLPAMLHQIFEQQSSASAAPAGKTGNVVSLPVPSGRSEVDSRFKEAVLVAAIIKAFHEEGGQPLGNFRLQKAVYFARRFLGETVLDGEYLRKAAGPYNPTMRYSGGIKVALDKNWITPASGKYGPGHSPGAAIGEAQSWMDKYNFTQAAAWVRDKFKFKQKDIWELLATIDYAMLALSHQGTNPTSQAVLSYIDQDPEWHPKIAKLGLTEPAIQNAMVELESLFPAAIGAK